MNKIVISLCTLLICEANFFANAQDTSSQLKNKIALNGELLCDTWQIDASYHYFVLPYIGFGGSIGMWKQYTVDGIPSGRGWTVDEDYENVENFFIHPSISLVSPCVAKIEEGYFNLFFEPGIMMNIPYNNVLVALLNERGSTIGYKKVSTNKGRWYAFDYKIGLSLTYDQFGCSIGYIHSDLDIFGMRRNMIFDGKLFNAYYPERKNPHGCFVSFFYLF